MKYIDLPSHFYVKTPPRDFPKARFFIRNPLFLKADQDSVYEYLHSFTEPLAAAYRGHQFGYSTMLGDGRAHLLGERNYRGLRYEIGLKGSGQTPFSRGGDGRATLVSSLREFVLSEAMAALSIPTSRSLAVIETRETVLREKAEPGGVLLRAMVSFARMGSIEYALQTGGLKELLDYLIERLDPDLSDAKNRLDLFLERIILRQADLIAQWMAVGFIHGVMNTDNVALSGETLDYGPAAFMESFAWGRVFSRIDTTGRYAYGRQVEVGAFNMSLLVNLLRSYRVKADEEEDRRLMNLYLLRFQKSYHQRMEAKTGGMEPDFWLSLLQWMEKKGADYTNTFADLSTGEFSLPLYEDEEFQALRRRFEEKGDLSRRRKAMQKVNPRLIVRNKLLEELIQKSIDSGNAAPLDPWLLALQDPFNYDQTLPESYLKPMSRREEAEFYTTCGT